MIENSLIYESERHFYIDFLIGPIKLLLVQHKSPYSKISILFTEVIEIEMPSYFESIKVFESQMPYSLISVRRYDFKGVNSGGVIATGNVIGRLVGIGEGDPADPIPTNLLDLVAQ